MLEARGVDYRYREYTREPLDAAEIREVLAELGLEPAQVLRRHDAVARRLGLKGDEGSDALVELMAEHPTLLQRPIGRRAGRAVVGRPPEALLGLVD